MCDFQPGDVVVCVDDQPRAPVFSTVNVTKGACYTVSRVYDPSQTRHGRASVELNEVTLGRGQSYVADRFRRVYRPDGTLTASLLKPKKARA
jgi:hypothetical protein